MKLLQPKFDASALTAVVSLLLSAVAMPGYSAGYTVREIPVPTQIKSTAGQLLRPVCLSINAVGQVACNLEIIEALTPTPLDRFAKRPKKFASYAYRWDSVTNAIILLSPANPGRLDTANIINDAGLVGGSTDTLTTKKPQGTIWSGIGFSLFGSGAITDLNNPGDYVLNDQLFINGKAVTFPGTQVKVEAINPVAAPVTALKVAGKQFFSQISGEAGTGVLYRVKPAVTKPKPWFALPTINNDVTVTDLTDNGNFVISGTPQTVSAFVALSCTGVANCQFYFPTVGAARQFIPQITLNAVDKARHAVGTDGGIALLVNPPTAAFPNGERVFLNSKLQPGDLGLGWFLQEATDINNSGKIIGTGIKGNRRIAFLLTPKP